MAEEKRIRFPKFKERLNILKGDMTIKAFAEKIGVSLPTAGFYLNGDRLPDALGVHDIASKCEVSADWLLGLSDVQKSDADLRVVCEYTGLTEQSVDILHSVLAITKKYNPAHPYNFSWISNFINRFLACDLGLRNSVVNAYVDLIRLIESCESCPTEKVFFDEYQFKVDQQTKAVESLGRVMLVKSEYAKMILYNAGQNIQECLCDMVGMSKQDIFDMLDYNDIENRIVIDDKSRKSVIEDAIKKINDEFGDGAAIDILSNDLLAGDLSPEDEKE